MRYLVVLSLFIFIGGCGSKESSDKLTPPATVGKAASTMPEGWQEVKAENIHMGLPKEWQVADLTQGDFDKMMSSLKFGPGAEGLKGQIKQMADSGMFKLFAFGPKMTKGFQENININATPVREANLEEGKTSILTQMKTVAPDASAEVLKSPECILVTATMDAQGPSGPIKYATRGYMFLKAGKGYTFTFSCSVDDRAAMAEFADKVAKTIAID